MNEFTNPFLAAKRRRLTILVNNLNNEFNHNQFNSALMTLSEIMKILTIIRARIIIRNLF